MSSEELFCSDYPIYSLGLLGDGGAEFYVTGGGGKSKTGIPNSLDVRRLSCEDGVCVAIPVHHHDMGDDVVMNSATNPKSRNQMAVGVGGECVALEIAKRDVNKSPKKESKVKRRKMSKSDTEDTSSVSDGESRVVTVKARVQTDFSKECYQKVVAFTCESVRVVTGGSDGVVRVWEYPSLKKVCELKGHKTEIITLSTHPSKQQVVSMCKGGRAIVWDLTNHDQEHSFTWSPWQQQAGNTAEENPTYKFRSCCFSQNLESNEVSHTSLYTLNIPTDARKEKRCYLVRWDADAWVVDEKTGTGKELLSALAIDGSGRFVGVGTISGSILIYSSNLKLLSRVPAVHAGFVTGLLFLALPTKTPATSSSGKQVSKPEKQVLISISVDRTCSATPVKKTTGSFTFLFLSTLFVSFVVLLVAVVTKRHQLW